MILRPFARAVIAPLLCLALCGCLLCCAVPPARAQTDAEVAEVYRTLLDILHSPPEHSACDYHLHVMIALDISGSMNNAKGAAFKKAWADAAESFLRPGDQVDVLPFGGVLHEDLARSTTINAEADRKTIAKDVDFAVATEGGTCFSQAHAALLKQALQQMERKESSLLILMVVTDLQREDTPGKSDQDAFMNAERQADKEQAPTGALGAAISRLTGSAPSFKQSVIDLRSATAKGKTPELHLHSMTLGKYAAKVSSGEERDRYTEAKLNPAQGETVDLTNPGKSSPSRLRRPLTALLLALLGAVLLWVPARLLRLWWQTLVFDFDMDFEAEDVFKGNTHFHVKLKPGAEGEEEARVIATGSPEPHKDKSMFVILDPGDSMQRVALHIRAVLKAKLLSSALEWQIKTGQANKFIAFSETPDGDSRGEWVIAFPPAGTDAAPRTFYLGFENQERRKLRFTPGGLPERIRLDALDTPLLKWVDVPIDEFKRINIGLAAAGFTLLAAALFMLAFPKKQVPPTPLPAPALREVVCRQAGSA